MNSENQAVKQADWWFSMLESYKAIGRADAGKGEYSLPYQASLGDPADEDCNEAYKDGWRERRRELGDKFKWFEGSAA